MPEAKQDSATAGSKAHRLGPLVTLLFFIWGFTTVLNDTLIPKLKAVYALSYAQAMLTQLCFFMAYFALSVPAGVLLQRIGYLRGIVTGLAIMGAGCLLFAPAAALGTYGGFLGALFVLASGITILQVAANPLIALLGSFQTSHSRLNLAQAFNSIGTTIGPFIGSALLLSGGLAAVEPGVLSAAALDSYRREATHAVGAPYAIFGLALLLLALLFWSLRSWGEALVPPKAAGAGLALLGRPRLALGALSIFLYVGAEVSIGSHLVSYLMMDRTLGATATRAGYLISLYWGGMMVGRFIGSWALTHVAPGKALCACAIGAAALAATSAASSGPMAAVAILAVGLCNSIMFPTIFTLSIEGLGDDTPEGSGLLCLAIFGGAVVPPLMGLAADTIGLNLALLVPAACYLWIAVYGALVATAPLAAAQRVVAGHQGGI